MSIEESKKELIQLIEKLHQDLDFPKNFFGCMFAVFLEQKPITQDRVMELTGYSRSTVSQMLNFLLRNFKLVRIKEPKIRKKYYSFSLSPRKFMLEFFKTIIEVYREGAEFTLPLIDESSKYVNDHDRFKSLHTFLQNFYHNSNIFLNLHVDTYKELEQLILFGKLDESIEKNYSIVGDSKYLENLQELVKTQEISRDTNLPEFKSKQQAELYFQLKEEFFQQFRTNLSQPQVMSARTIIGTELLLERRPLTQEEIEESTNLARSLISAGLNQLLEYTMVQVFKKLGDRRNYYSIYQSWDKRLINRLRASVFYSKQVYEIISKMIENMKLLQMKEEVVQYISLLSEIHHSYVQFEKYYQYLEIKFVKSKMK